MVEVSLTALRVRLVLNCRIGFPGSEGSGRRESDSGVRRAWLYFGLSEVMRLEKVAGPVMWRVRVCLVVVVRCLRARVEIREACMVVVMWIARKDWERER